MDDEDVKRIQEWLAKGRLVTAELVKTPNSREMELRLSKENSDGDTEYVTVGIPLSRPQRDMN